MGPRATIASAGGLTLLLIALVVVLVTVARPDPVDSQEESPPHDLAGGGEVRQGGEVLGQVEAMADCRYTRETIERCVERRSFPRTTIDGVRDLRTGDLLVTVPTAWRVEVRALRGDELLPRWREGAQIIDYGAIDDWLLPEADQRRYTNQRTPPAAADALRVVAYGDDSRARGFELAIP